METCPPDAKAPGSLRTSVVTDAGKQAISLRNAACRRTCVSNAENQDMSRRNVPTHISPGTTWP
eukprot:7066483-Karenia_brevis.AAC.1